MNIIETHGTLEIRTFESIVSVSRVVQIIISLVTSSKESTNIYIYTYWNSLSTLFHACFARNPRVSLENKRNVYQRKQFEP